MNIKVHWGGNSTYVIAGSSATLANYLQHEDLKRMQQGQAPEQFFNH